MTYIPSVRAFVDDANSSTVTLSANATFTGTAVETTLYETIHITLRADQAGAESGALAVEFSQDASNWDISKTISYNTANAVYSDYLDCEARYYRVIFTNGPTAQGFFRLQSILQPYPRFGNQTTEVTVIPSERSLDSFFRTKVSNPITQFDVHNVGQLNTYQIADKTTGSGAITYNPNAAVATMSVTTSGDSVVRQTRQRGIYQPGKSLQILMTGRLDTSPGNASTVTTEIGYGDNNDGFFFRRVDGVTYVVKRAYITGSVVETAVAQSSWNMDRVDGTGNSGNNVNWLFSQIFYFDVEWLGVGRVRMGMFIAGAPIVVHEFRHSNLVEGTYTSRASLPVRYSISSTGGAGSMANICCTVISDGGYNPGGRQFGYLRDNANSSTIGTSWEPLMSLRIRPSETTGSFRPFRKTLILPKQITIASTTGANLAFRVIIYRGVSNPTTILAPTGGDAAPSWVSPNDSAAGQVDITANSTTVNTATGAILITGYVSKASDFAGIDLSANNIFVGTDVDGNSDLLVLLVQTLGGNEAVFSSITWQEFN